MCKVNIADVIVTPNTNIPEALKAINKNGIRGVFVCDDNDEIFGIIMDSDIRRAILSKRDLNASVKTIMKTSPFAISQNVPKAERSKLLINSDKLLAPIIDAENRVVDYIYLPDILSEVFREKNGTVSLQDNRILPPQKVLVIGGSGYIGSVLVKKLLRMGYQVRVLDLLLYGKIELQDSENNQLEFIRGDCRDEKIIKQVIEGVDAIVHLGEIVGDPACSINETFTIDTNYAATQMIVEECMKFQVKRFLFASSCSVYGHNDEMVDEESPINPVSLYARCKIESEKAILSCGYDHFCPTILRLATAHGKSFRQRFDLVVNLLAIKAAAEGKITIFGGQQWRPFISVRDICEGIVSVLRMERSKVEKQIFNLGDTRENFRMIEIGNMIKKILPETNVEVVMENVDRRNYRVSFEKIKNCLGFTSEYRIVDTITDLVKAYRDENLFHDYKDSKYHNHLCLK